MPTAILVPTVAQLRTGFPEFVSNVVYPNDYIQFWIDFAVILLNKHRWGTLYPMGIMLYVAHNLALEKQARDAAANGGTPGVATGPVSGKTVGKVSIDYDSGSSSIPGAGEWNLTTYGLRFYRLLNIVGMGPIQLNIGVSPNPLFNVGAAWSGPYPYPGPTGFS